MTTPAATVDLERLNRRFQSLRLRLAGLQGQARELQTRRATLTHDVSLAKARIELAPEATEVFNYLQEKAHARAVGEFEDLLTAFVEDVVPEAGRIHLELGTERGAPALDILLDNGGDLEDILEGNGGGLTNVVVTGLGFSALSRTSNRQLILLDEPDCWLKSVNVPNFTKVIAEVSNPTRDEDGKLSTGCQTLMISHNDISLMDDGAHIQDLRVERDIEAFAARHGVTVEYVGEATDCAYVVWVPGKGSKKDSIQVRYRPAGEGDDELNALTKGFPYLESISGARTWESDDQVGVRWIECTNVRTHVRTRLNLSSGLNVLTGQVNAGKSNLYFTALRAMAYGESDDRMIRHGADCAIIRLGLESGVELEMVRNRNAAPKVMYRRYENGVLTNEGRQESRSSVPAFISDSLGINRVDGLDIQLRHQKQPVFLLNETPARRAQLLSVGRESGLLQALIERHRTQLRRDKEQVKRDEIELAQVNRTLTVLEPLTGMSTLVDILNGMMDEAREAQGKLEAIRALVNRMQPLYGPAMLLEGFREEFSRALVVPKCEDTRTLVSLVSRVERTHLTARLPDLPVGPIVPGVNNIDVLVNLLAKLTTGAQAAALFGMLPGVPGVPDVADVAKLGEVMARLKKGAQASVLSSALPAVPLLPEVKDTAALRRDGVSLSQRKAAIEVGEKDEKLVLEEERQANDALHALKHELGVCPVCNQTFKEESHA